MDIIKVSKTINAPLQFVFKWCTDFSEDDPKITGSKSQRKILYKSRKNAVYAQIYKDDKGKQKIGVNFVTLGNKSWHLDFYGEEDIEIGEYMLTSLGREKTRLDMVFKEKWKIPNPPSQATQFEQTSKVWDKFVAALEHDYKTET